MHVYLFLLYIIQSTFLRRRPLYRIRRETDIFPWTIPPRTFPLPTQSSHAESTIFSWLWPRYDTDPVKGQRSRYDAKLSYYDLHGLHVNPLSRWKVHMVVRVSSRLHSNLFLAYFECKSNSKNWVRRSANKRQMSNYIDSEMSSTVGRPPTVLRIVADRSPHEQSAHRRRRSGHFAEALVTDADYSWCHVWEGRSH